MKRIAILIASIALAAALCIGGVAGTVRAEPPATQPTAADVVDKIFRSPTTHSVSNGEVPTPDDKKTQDLLDRKLPEVRFDTVGFADVIDFLRDVTGANIFVNWKALERADIDRNVPVSARLRDIKFSKVLDTVLKAASNEKATLAWRRDDGVIEISTAADLQLNLVTKVYDVRFLAKWRKNAAATQPSTKPTEPADPLLRILYGSFAPASWKVAGGAGEIKEVGGQLIISATEENHRAIGVLIDNLQRLVPAE